MRLEMSDDERRMLLDLLREELGRLKGEIYKTEAAEFKADLKEREALLVAIIARLEGAESA
jgi:hypothetical protein